MVLGNLLFSLFFNAFGVVKIELPEIETKQSVANLRFISKDGRFTYYQRRSGSLLLSTNYEVEEVLKGPIGTQYTISSTKRRKYNLIEQSINYHTYLSVRKLNRIYYTSFGEKNKVFMGQGIDAQLHSEENWISYYNPYKNLLSFNNIVNPSANFEIKLQNNKNPYFIPQRKFISKEVVLYTDLNKDGVSGLISFNRSSKKTNLLQKAENSHLKYELCANDNNVFIGTFSTNHNSPYSSITSYLKKDFNLGKGSILYDNNKNDIGQLICDQKPNKIFFVKDYSKEYGSTGYEAVELDIETKKIKNLSSLKWVNTIINMDERLLLPFRGAYYVLDGTSDLSNTDNLAPSANSPEELEKKK